MQFQLLPNSSVKMFHIILSELFHCPHLSMWTVPFSTSFYVSCSIVHVILCELFHCPHHSMWTVPLSTSFYVNCSIVHITLCELFHFPHHSMWTVPFSTSFYVNCSIQILMIFIFNYHLGIHQWEEDTPQDWNTVQNSRGGLRGSGWWVLHLW